jgi:predicted site-specific integrase-resolvase
MLNMGTIYRYARVSTGAQDLTNRVARLNRQR